MIDERKSIEYKRRKSYNWRLKIENFSVRVRKDFKQFVKVREKFFFVTVVDGWNRFASSQIIAPSVNSFKSQIDILVS